MNHILRQDYKDITLQQIPHDHNICQLKYDGIWCAAHARDHNITYISRNGLIKRTDTNVPISDGIYIGELMFGSEWAQDPTRKDKFFVFDCLESHGTNIRAQSYELRYSVLQHALFMFAPTDWVLVPNYAIDEAENIWLLLVDSGLYEGLVFRNSKDPWNTVIHRAKKEITVDLTIVGVMEGAGRLQQTLGALQCIRPTKPDQIVTVGGGLTDSLRQKIWNNPDQYYGRTIRVTAKKVFESGLLRHPNFHSFHDDK